MHAVNKNTIDEVVVGMSIAGKIRHWRKVRGLTQHQLALLIKTNQPAISRVEDDAYLPSMSFLIRIAKALNKRIEIKFK